jgi:hypothetical protein
MAPLMGRAGSGGFNPLPPLDPLVKKYGPVVDFERQDKD